MIFIYLLKLEILIFRQIPHYSPHVRVVKSQVKKCSLYFPHIVSVEYYIKRYVSPIIGWIIYGRTEAVNTRQFTCIQLPCTFRKVSSAFILEVSKTTNGMQRSRALDSQFLLLPTALLFLGQYRLALSLRDQQ